QRYGLGLVCRDILVHVQVPEVHAVVARLLAKRPRDRPGPDEARRVFEGATGEGASLSQGCDTPARLRFERRTPSRIAARLAQGTRGILEPCVVCGRPALASSSRDVPVGDGRYRPDCCWRARDRRKLRLI